MWEILQNSAYWTDFAGDLEDSKSISGGTLCVFGSHTFVSNSWMSDLSSWSYDMEGRAKKCVERFCELANRTTEQLYKSATPCMDDHQVREQENGSVGKLTAVSSQIVLKYLYLARIGRPDIFVVCERTCSCGSGVDKSM